MGFLSVSPALFGIRIVNQLPSFTPCYLLVLSASVCCNKKTTNPSLPVAAEGSREGSSNSVAFFVCLANVPC